jgi:predicted nucleotidyltransferase
MVCVMRWTHACAGKFDYLTKAIFAKAWAVDVVRWLVGDLASTVRQMDGVIIVFKMTVIDSIPPQDIVRFCQRWQVREMALFGSALRPDFTPESDVDILISFHEVADWGLFDHVQMRLDLEAIFQRKVDLVSRRALEQTRNELLRESILKTAKVIFANNEAVYAEG